MHVVLWAGKFRPMGSWDCLTCNRTNQNQGPLIEEKKKKMELIKKKRGEARSAGAEGADPVAAATPSIASNSFRIRTELSTILMR